MKCSRIPLYTVTPGLVLSRRQKDLCLGQNFMKLTRMFRSYLPIFSQSFGAANPVALALRQGLHFSILLLSGILPPRDFL